MRSQHTVCKLKASSLSVNFTFGFRLGRVLPSRPRCTCYQLRRKDAAVTAWEIKQSAYLLLNLLACLLHNPSRVLNSWLAGWDATNPYIESIVSDSKCWITIEIYTNKKCWSKVNIQRIRTNSYCIPALCAYISMQKRAAPCALCAALCTWT